MKIPQMFYLRKTLARVLIGRGRYVEHVFFTYWNYRGTVTGIVTTEKREVAKAMIVADQPDADFWR
jgi:hypothetical protein